MAYQVDKFNGTFLVSVADGTVDTTTDLRLLGKNYAGYGEVQNENFLHLLENFANTSAPPKAINGQVWFDSANKKLKFYDADNNKWRTTGSLEVGATAPLKMNTGDFWWDTSASQLYSWDGSTFVLIGPQAGGSTGGGAAGTKVDNIKGTDGLNHIAVRLFDGADNTIAIISNEEFTYDPSANIDLNPTLSGYTVIKKGITLVNTPTSGITTSDHILWGTASNALKLGGVSASEFVQKGSSSFTSQVAFTNAGYTVGTPGNNLAVFIELGDQPVIESRNAARITMRVREGVNLAHDIMEFIAPTTNPGAAIPGLGSTFDLGSQLYKWSTVYADTFAGNLTGAVTGNTTGVHKGNVLAADNSVAYNAATKVFTGAFTGIVTGALIGDITGSAGDSARLAGLAGSTSATGSTVVLRDISGNVTANLFEGTATRANELRVNGGSYQTASTSPTANTVVARDSSGNITANFVNSTATAANSIQVDGAAYRTASAAAIGNTVVVRDPAGNIAVNGIIGSATQADLLQINGTTYGTASTNALANTVVARDGNGVIRAASIQNTPIGSVTANTGAFTSLTATSFTAPIANSTINNTSIGASTRNTGAFTSLTANGLSVTTTSAVGSTAGNTVLYSRFQGTNPNQDFLDISQIRTSAGSDWTTSGSRIQQRVDSTYMGYMQFNGHTANGGVSWGAGTSTVSATSIPEYMRLDTAGSLRLLGNVSSSSTTTGTLIVTGGVGISGQLTVGALVETSSIAYKENVSPIANALNSVLQLTGVTYDRKDGSAVHEAGLIAEEVNKVLPNIISYKDGKPEGIQYTKIIAYLVEAVKELKSEVENLKK